MLLRWNILFILLYFFLLTKGINIENLKITFKALKNESVTKSITLKMISETIKGPFIYGKKKLENIKVVRLNMKHFNGLNGVKGNFNTISSQNSSSNAPKNTETFITIFESENIVHKSLNLKSMEIECSIKVCHNGLILISQKKIEKIDGIEDNSLNGIFMLFTHDDIFFPVSTLNIVEYKNPLVKCPQFGNWISKNKFLEYKQHESFVIYNDEMLHSTFSIYPAIKTNSKKNIMECGSIFFNSKKILTIGYNLRIDVSVVPRVIEIEQIRSLDCSLIEGGTTLVEHHLNKFLYVPLKESHKMIPYVQHLKSFDTVIKSGVYLIYPSHNTDSENIPDKPFCSYLVKPKDLDLKFQVTLMNNKFKEKKLNLNNTIKNIKTLEIDIYEETNNNLQNTKNLECSINTIFHRKNGETLNEELKDKLKNYYSTKYKCGFVKLDYDGTKVSIPKNAPILFSLSKSIKFNSFDKFGLYQCRSIDSSNKFDAPSNVDNEFGMFMILPKEDNGAVEEVSTPYKDELQGKGECVVNKQQFGLLESISFDNIKVINTVSISNLQKNENFKYTNNKNGVVYKGEIERQNKLICIYKTNFNMTFKITKIFDYKTDSNFSSRIFGMGMNGGIYVIIAAVIAVGLIGVAVVVAVVLLKKRRRRRKKIKKMCSKVNFNNTVSSLSSSSNSLSESVSTSESSKDMKSKNKTKMGNKNSKSSVSVSGSFQNSKETKNSKNTSRTSSVIRFAAK
ncbi:Hypothetical protein SRAE_1000070400 [Strongyloides ratti]|uniref:DUF7583 domain-containing protein n=1 Tax=Strongyloides ratti TaxID=34506 RepID=A0A090KYB6_STRRB|nr:Hypothetical protein SRAE_1000070400 [Strongyloides ratti]CEF62431.1 Hypothetical protein SRAE_1000070400 [Strongyloides ratti]